MLDTAISQCAALRYEAWYDVTHPTLYDVQLRVGAGNNVSTKINATTEVTTMPSGRKEWGLWERSYVHQAG